MRFLLFLVLIVKLIFILEGGNSHLCFTLRHNIVTGRAAASFFIKKLGCIREVVFLFPEMTGGTQLAKIIKGIGCFAAFNKFFDGVITILILCFTPVIEEGCQYSPVGCHKRVFDFFDVGRMTPFHPAGFFNHPQISWIEYHSLVSRILVNVHGIAKVTG